MIVVNQNGEKINTDNCPKTACIYCRKCSSTFAWDFHAKVLQDLKTEQERRLIDGE